MNYGIVGSSGYIGRNLKEALDRDGNYVYEISSKTRGGINETSGIFDADLKFPNDLDVVYYLSQSPNYRNVPQYAPHVCCVNCISAIQAALAASRSGVKKFIYASTGNVYLPSFQKLNEESALQRTNWYSLSKVMGEESLKLLESETFKIIRARIFGVYGPGQTDKLVPLLTKSIVDGKTLHYDLNPFDEFDDGGVKISLMYIDDIVHSLKLLSSSDFNGPINLAGNFSYSVRDIVEKVSTLLKLPYELKPTGKFRSGDLIADTSLANQLIQINLTQIDDGLKQTLSNLL